jgi:hypothetical protein
MRLVFVGLGRHGDRPRQSRTVLGRETRLSLLALVISLVVESCLPFAAKTSAKYSGADKGM